MNFTNGSVHKTIAEITFMYFKKPILKSLSCISKNLYWNHFQVFHYWAGRLEQLDHTQNSLLSSSLSGRSPGIIRPLAKFFTFFFTIGQVAWSNQTTRQILCIHRQYQTGCLKQLDHSWNSSHSFSISGRSPGTIRPLVSFLEFYHRVGRLEQLDHLWVSSNFIIGLVAWNN